MEVQNLDKYIKNKFPENLATSASLDDLQAQTIRILQSDFEKFVSTIKENETRGIASVSKKTREMADNFQGSGGYLTLSVRLLSQYQRLRELSSKLGQKSQAAIAKLLQSPEFNSKSFLRRAETSFEEVKELLLSEEERVTKESEIDITFYFGGTGIYLNGCILSQIKNDSEGFLSNLEKLLKYKSLLLDYPEDYFEELLYGASGYLYCLLSVQTHCSGLLNASGTYQRLQEELIDTVKYVIDAGIRNYGPEVDLNNLPKDFRLVYRFYGQEYFGAAHGLFGILYILLRAYQINNATFIKEYQELGNKLLTTVRASLKYVLPFQTGSGNFPSSAQGKVALVQFCHGAPGAVSCCLIAAEVFKDEEIAAKCKEAASLAGEAIWNSGILRKGYGLCHGICGNGYSFLTLYKHTLDKKWLYRALCFVSTKEDRYYTDEIAKYHVDDRFTVGKSDFPYSLMLGLAGDICMEVDCLLPETTRFPGYEV